MNEALKIFVDQLRDGHTEKIHETVSSSFLDLDEKDARFDEKVSIDGDAYLADQELILHLDIQAKVFIPCSICNTSVALPVDLSNVYYSIPPEDFKSGVFYMGDLLREAILLETPRFAECNQGKCPQRKELSKYIREEDQNNTYHPFADLDFDENDK